MRNICALVCTREWWIPWQKLNCEQWGRSKYTSLKRETMLCIDSTEGIFGSTACVKGPTYVKLLPNYLILLLLLHLFKWVCLCVYYSFYVCLLCRVGCAKWIIFKDKCTHSDNCSVWREQAHSVRQCVIPDACRTAGGLPKGCFQDNK